MSRNPNNSMLPDDENQNQTGNQGQNPGQYPSQYSIHGNSWDPSLSNTAPNEPVQGSNGQNAGLNPGGQQPPMPQVQHANQPNPSQPEDLNCETRDIPKISHGILDEIFKRPAPNPQAQAQACDSALCRLRHLLQRYTDNVAMIPSDNDSSLDVPNLFPIEDPGSTDLDPNNTGNVDYTPAEPAPVESQREPHSTAVHHNVVNTPLALPSAPTFQASFGGPSPKKRGRAASPDTTVPAPKRMRNLQPSTSSDEGDNANSSEIPGPAPNTTSPSSRQLQRTRKRKADIDEEEHDGENDLVSDPRPQKKPRGEPAASKTKSNYLKDLKKEDHEKVVAGTICIFCRENPQSRECNWEQVRQSNGPELTNRQNKETYSPGPLYYLALGYGAGGVNDLKDGQKLEHWIGPAAPMYGLTDAKGGPEQYRFVAASHQHHRPPEGIALPPIPSGDKQLKDTSASELRWLVARFWLNQQPQVPKNDLQGYQKVWDLLRDHQNLQMKTAGMEHNLPPPISGVRCFQGGPVLSDIWGTQDPMLPSALGNANDTQSQGFSPSLTYQPSNQYGNGYNPQQNVSAPQTQLHQPSAAQQPLDFTYYRNESGQDPAAFGQDGGFDQQQLHTLTRNSQLADQPMHGGPDQEPFDYTHGELQMAQGHVPPTPQGWGNLNQEQLDSHSQTGLPQDQTGDQQNSQSGDTENWYEKLAPLVRGTADDESGERPPYANSAILAKDTENDQQEPHSGPQAPDQSPEGGNESQDEFSSLVDWEGGQTHRRSQASRGERWLKPQTSRGSKKSSQERTAGGSLVPKKANGRDAFNPFLGFTFGPDQKPRFTEKPKGSRWKVFNHLEGIDMSEWHESKSKEPEEESQVRLFSIVNGQTNQPTPVRNVLGDVPREDKVIRTKRYCAEPGEGGWGSCAAWNTDGHGQATCQSSAHRNTALPYFPVCNDCTRGNVKYLFQHEHNPITESELLSMRAYLCNECAGQMSAGAPNAVQNQIVGTRRVYGIAADEAQSQNRRKLVNGLSKAANLKKNTEALTGCSCANRMLGTSLCRFHRLYYAEEVMKQAALMQEWRLSRFKKAVCPSCLAQKPSEQVNVSANVDGFVTGAPTAWACVVCNDWVVNEQNDVNNQPKVIDKPLWNLNIGRKLLGPHREIATGRVLGEVVSV
ncbi:hypothetical protein FVER53590_06393 [Fusarium verticillioides]|nr:hypothetical protein FVER53590_06393 [Fusarium verticillioides]